jgi:hypothetical protein
MELIYKTNLNKIIEEQVNKIIDQEARIPILLNRFIQPTLDIDVLYSKGLGKAYFAKLEAFRCVFLDPAGLQSDREKMGIYDHSKGEFSTSSQGRSLFKEREDENGTIR